MHICELFEHDNGKRYLNLSKQTSVVTGLVYVEVLPGHAVLGILEC